jgi:hypothetical protein
MIVGGVEGSVGLKGALAGGGKEAPLAALQGAAGPPPHTSRRLDLVTTPLPPSPPNKPTMVLCCICLLPPPLECRQLLLVAPLQVQEAHGVGDVGAVETGGQDSGLVQLQGGQDVLLDLGVVCRTRRS